MIARLLIVGAFLPAMIGPLPDPSRSIVATICSESGSRTIDISLPEHEPDSPVSCHGKACHAGRSRKQIDPAQ